MVSGSESSDESESQTNNDFQTSPFGSEANSGVESESKSPIPSDWSDWERPGSSESSDSVSNAESHSESEPLESIEESDNESASEPD